MIKHLFLLVLLLSINTICFGQRNLLMLQKKNKNKTVYYEPGDVITFKTTETKSKMTGKIVALKDSVIVFQGFEVRVDKISCLYLDEKTKWWLRYKIAQLCLIGGTGYLLLDVINSGEVNEDTMIVSGTIIGVGLLAKLLIGNKIKIKGKTKLRILKL